MIDENKLLNGTKVAAEIRAEVGEGSSPSPKNGVIPRLGCGARRR